MNRLCLIFFIVLIMVSLFSPNIIGGEVYSAYRTLEGEISLTGWEPFVEPILVTEDNDIYTISGEYREEIKKLSRMKVKVTGGVSSSYLPEVDGDIEAEIYSITGLDYGEDIEWVVGLVRETEKDIVLLGKNQVVYKLKKLADDTAQKLIGSKVVLMGEINSKKDYQAEMDVDGYIVLE